MRDLASKVAEALLLGAATYAGVRLMQELADPYSGLRLRSSSIVDQLREVRKR
jgi:hypothetical protein